MVTSSRIVTAVEQPLVGRAAFLDLVRCKIAASRVQLACSARGYASLTAAPREARAAGLGGWLL
jgi:hypothetical protein